MARLAKLNGVIFVLALSWMATALSLFIAFVFLLPFVPGRLDQVLLTNDELCYEHPAPTTTPQPTASTSVSAHATSFSEYDAKLPSKIHIDYGDYRRKLLELELGSEEDKLEQSAANVVAENGPSLNKNVNNFNNHPLRRLPFYHRLFDYFLWRMALEAWENIELKDSRKLEQRSEADAKIDLNSIEKHNSQKKSVSKATSCPIDDDQFIPKQENGESCSNNCAGAGDFVDQSFYDGDGKIKPDKVVDSGVLHPLCKSYRELRSRVRIEQLLIPWDWLYRCEFRVMGISLHAISPDISFTSRRVTTKSSGIYLYGYFGWVWHLWSIFWSLLSGDVYCTDGIMVDVVNSDGGRGHSLPPSVQIENVAVSFRSWTKPVVSADFNGVNLNIVMKKGGLPIISNLDEILGTEVLVGDMTIQEALQLLPKPPEEEGLYPRIGVMNVTNVTMNLYTTTALSHRNVSPDKKNADSSLNQLMRMKVSDKVFHPVSNLTTANSPMGIDQMHFQPLVQSAFSNALRQHLNSEAEKAISNSWTAATNFTDSLKSQASKVQEHFNNFALRSQELYLDRWIGMIDEAWQQTQENIRKGFFMDGGKNPLLDVVWAWVDDLKKMPATPLMNILNYHWNKLFDAINKSDMSLDKKIWTSLGELKDTLDGLLAKSKGTDLDKLLRPRPSIEKRITNHLQELKKSIDDLVSKSNFQDIENFLEDCEKEFKERWADFSLGPVLF